MLGGLFNVHYLKPGCNKWAPFLMHYLRFQESALGGFSEGEKKILFVDQQSEN